MARNRKNESSAIRFLPALQAMLLCLLIGGSAVGYVLQKNKLHDLGAQIKKREIALEKLKADNNVRLSQLANLQMPARLMEQMKDKKTGLVPSQPFQWILLAEPSIPEPANRASSVFVAGK